MPSKANAPAATGNGPLAFEKGKGVDAADLKTFLAAVDDHASKVSSGIVEALRKEKLDARARQAPDGNWVITVGSAGGGPAAHNLEARIRIDADGGDIPRIVGALGGFFGNWRAVAGLIAVGAAYVAGAYVLRVDRAA